MRGPVWPALLLMLPVASVMADVDVLGLGGEVYLAWTDGTGSMLAIHGTGHERSFVQPEISIGEVGGGLDYLTVALSHDTGGYDRDSLYVLDPADLSTVMGKNVLLPELVETGSGNAYTMALRVARYNGPDSGIWVHATGNIYNPGYEGLVSLSLRYVPDPSLGIILDEELFHQSGMWYSGRFDDISRPVLCGAAEVPTMFTRWDYYWHGPEQAIFSSTHIPWQPGTYVEMEGMDWSTVYRHSFYDELLVKASGSCSDEVLLLWTREDSLGTMCSTFDGLSSDTVCTWDTGFDLDHERPWAMSCDPADDGLLLTWADDDAVLFRYYDGGWSPLTGTVRTGVGSIGEDDLAVCSDDDGYWVAWLEEGRAYPELEFVPGDSVTALGERVGVLPPMLTIDVPGNPQRGSASVTIGAPEEAAGLAVYDISGRLVLELAGVRGHQPLELPGGGVYLLRATSGRHSVEARLVFID